MLNKGPSVSSGVALAIIALAVGAAGGYYGRYMSEKPGAAGGGMGGSMMGGGMGGSGMGGGGMGGGGGGMGMMGGGNMSGMQLAGTVRNLAAIQKAQGQGLTAEQAAQLKPILAGLKSADKVDAKTADSDIEAINKVLTQSQKDVLESMSFRRPGGGRGGPGGPGGRPGGSGMGGSGMMGRSGMGGGPPMMGGSGMGGGRPDPEKPFASERNKKALDDLITSLK